MYTELDSAFEWHSMFNYTGITSLDKGGELIYTERNKLQIKK